MSEIVLNVPTVMLWVLTAVLVVSTIQNAVKAYLEWQIFMSQYAGAKIKAAAAAQQRVDAQREQPANRKQRRTQQYGH